jgi:hypothetical protein
MQENIIFILRTFSKYLKKIIEQYLETPEKNLQPCNFYILNRSMLITMVIKTSH